MLLSGCTALRSKWSPASIAPSVGTNPTSARYTDQGARHNSRVFSAPGGGWRRACAPEQEVTLELAGQSQWFLVLACSSQKPSQTTKEPPIRRPLVLVAQRGAGRNRTDEWRFCRPLPYHLATAPGSDKVAAGHRPAVGARPHASCGKRLLEWLARKGLACRTRLADCIIV